MNTSTSALLLRLRPIFSVLIGLSIAGIAMALSGYHAMEALSSLGSASTGLYTGVLRGSNDINLPGGAHLSMFVLAQSLSRITPLIFTGLSVAIGLRAGLFNIGCQGQMTVGALAAAVIGQLGITNSSTGQGSLPVWIHIPITLAAAAAAGGCWAGFAAWFKTKRGVHEVLSTIMLNYIAANIVIYLLTHNLKDPVSMAAQTRLMASSAWFTPLVPGANFSIGLFLALAGVALIAIIMNRTALGYEIRAVGQGTEAARTAGLPVARTMITAMFISGSLSGIAGAVEVMAIHHRCVQGVAGTYGFDGIAVALLGGLQAGGVLFSALFFGALSNGASYMQMQTDVPDSIAVIVQSVVIICIGIRYIPPVKFWNMRRSDARSSI